MRRLAFVLACTIPAGHGRRVEMASERVPSFRSAANEQEKGLTAFAMMLAASSPSAEAFNNPAPLHSRVGEREGIAPGTKSKVVASESRKSALSPISQVALAAATSALFQPHPAYAFDLGDPALWAWLQRNVFRDAIDVYYGIILAFFFTRWLLFDAFKGWSEAINGRAGMTLEENQEMDKKERLMRIERRDAALKQDLFAWNKKKAEEELKEEKRKIREDKKAYRAYEAQLGVQNKKQPWTGGTGRGTNQFIDEWLDEQEGKKKKNPMLDALKARVSREED